jgi:hypothetical protein
MNEMKENMYEHLNEIKTDMNKQPNKQGQITAK